MIETLSIQHKGGRPVHTPATCPLVDWTVATINSTLSNKNVPYSADNFDNWSMLFLEENVSFRDQFELQQHWPYVKVIKIGKPVSILYVWNYFQD